jgi:L,D-transpeptidase ErfK/SrfK
MGFKKGRIFIEVHEDIYNRIPDSYQFTFNHLVKKGIENLVELDKLKEALDQKCGLPIDITSNVDHGK